jgi:signal transduction histidine kinase
VSIDVSRDVPWLSDVSPGEMRRIIDVLCRVHHFIADITDLDTLLESIMEQSKEVAKAEACSLMLYDAESEELFFQVALGEHGDQQTLKREIRLKLNQGIAGAAAANCESINVADAQSDCRLFRNADDLSNFQTRSLLAVPLLDRGNLVGVLEVVNKEGGPCFTEADLRIMEMFGSIVATAIANARLIEENIRAERLAAIGQAVAGLSHYAKNIITGMGGSVDLIDQGMCKGNTEFLTQSWPILRRSLRRISALVEDMLAYSKPRQPAMEDCQIAAVFEEATEAFLGLLSRKTITLNVDSDGVPGPVRMESHGIFRCLLNLLNNAADALPSQGGRIDLTATITADGNLQLDVADNGPGVPDEFAPKLFDPFFSTKGSRGTGLGLAVTEKIVKEHGGAIAVMRASAGGALFRITLPQGPTAESEQE